MVRVLSEGNANPTLKPVESGGWRCGTFRSQVNKRQSTRPSGDSPSARTSVREEQKLRWTGKINNFVKLTSRIWSLGKDSNRGNTSIAVCERSSWVKHVNCSRASTSFIIIKR